MNPRIQDIDAVMVYDPYDLIRKMSFSVWDKIADKYSRDSVTSRLHPEQEKILLAELEENSSVLDVGCSIGCHVMFLAEKGFNVVGVDYSRKMIEIAKKKLEEKNLRAELFVGDASNLMFEDKSFDYVVCMSNALGCIEGEIQRVNALKEMIRVSKKKVLLELLNSDITVETTTRYWFSNEDETYTVKRWSEEEIITLINQLGFKAEIRKGRQSIMEKYIFYAFINLEL